MDAGQKTVRVGVVGPSWWVDYWHLAAVQTHPYAEIVALCGEKPRDSAEVQAKYGANARYFTQLNSMLDAVQLDGVIVCTPNDLHHPVTLACLQRGLHVNCEKPLALNAAQAREMSDTARERSRIGMTNFPYRDNPAVQLFRQLVAEGWAGTPLHLSGSYHGGFGMSRPPNWRGKRNRSGAGILGDLGSHLIDLARFVTGDEFSAVCASSRTLFRADASRPRPEMIATEDPRVPPENLNDDACAFLAEFQSGAQGVFHTSWVAYQGAYRQHQELELYGTDGRLHFQATHSGTFLRGLKSGVERWETFHSHSVVPEDEDAFRPGRHTSNSTTYRWIEAIRTGQQDLTPTLEDGYRAQLVIDAVIEASAERRWIAVPPE